MKLDYSNEFAALIGIDWADRKHDLCLLDVATGHRERSVLEHTPKAVHAWAEQIRKRFTGRKVAVCLELSQGPIVSALLEHDFFVIFPVQPSLLAKYREAFTPSRAKDDPTDAEFALDLLLRYPDKIVRLKPESPNMRMLRQLVECRRGLVDDRVRVTNRITASLKAYFPQVLDLFREKDTGVFADFLERWPTIEAAKKARRSALESFFREHSVRYQATIDGRIAAIKGEVPLTTDAAVIAPAKLAVDVSLPQRAGGRANRRPRPLRGCRRWPRRPLKGRADRSCLVSKGFRQSLQRVARTQRQLPDHDR